MVHITTNNGVERAGKYLGIRIQLVGGVIDSEEERLEVVVLLNGYAQSLRRIVKNCTSCFDIGVIRT